MSLQAKLVSVLLVALAVALALMGYSVQWVLKGYLIDEIDRQLLGTATHASRDTRFLNGLLEHGSSATAALFPSQFRVQLSIDGHSDTVVLGGYPTNDEANLEFPLVSNARASSITGRTYTVAANDGSLWRASSFPVATTAGESGSITILGPLRGVDLAVAKVRFISITFGLLVMALCTLAGWLAIRRAFRPLREVEDTAAAIAGGDLSSRVRERPVNTEVGRLTASLNGMLTQIEQAFRHRAASEARTRRFAADASHELRTPLASIRGFAELYRQGAVPSDEVPRTMRRIEDEATRMGGLVEDLLLLARLDEQRPGRSEPVDLAVLANDAVHDTRGLDSTRRVSLVGLNGGGPTPSLVIGDEDRLRQVVANLMANAVRHTPEGTAIEVAVGITTGPEPRADGSPEATGKDDGGSRDVRNDAAQKGTGRNDASGKGTGRNDASGKGSPKDGVAPKATGKDVARKPRPAAAIPRAVLEVRDHGAGLTPEQAERVFERFYRVDSSRSRGKGGGSGLGLSIVSAVVAAHGGSVDTLQTPGGGATFRVELPSAPPGSTPG
jgi:two-component system OmpR family sensor kinase